MSLFPETMLNTEDKNGLNQEKKREMIGLMNYMQKFEFIFGIKLSIRLYQEIDSIANDMQGDNVSISNALEFVKKLIKNLEVKKEYFEYFWEAVDANRIQYNELAEHDQILQRSSMFDGIESASCPRITLKELCQVVDTDEEAIKAYWKENYVGVFDTILPTQTDRGHFDFFRHTWNTYFYY